MPIGVQLPGYRPGQAGGIAEVLGAINSMRTGSAQRASLEQETQSKQLANAQTAATMKYQQDLSDPNSVASESARNNLVADATVHKELGKQIGLSAEALAPFDQVINASKNGVEQRPAGQEGPGVMRPMSGLEAIRANDSPLFKGIESLREAQLKNAGQMTRAGALADSDVRGTSDEYHNRLKDYKNVNDDIKKIESVLRQKDKSGNPLITKQAMTEANFAFNRVMSPGHMSDAGLKETEYGSSSADFNDALQKLFANPRDTGARKLVEHMVDAAHRVGNVSNENAIRMLDNVDSGNRSLTIPGAQAAAKNTSAQYRKMFAQKYPEIGDGSQGGAHPQDKQAIAWAKQNPKDARSAAILKANAAPVAGDR